MALTPDRLTSLMKPPAGPAPTGAATDGEPPAGPVSAPMSTPEPKMGSKEGSLVNLGMALDLIEQALPSLGSESPEGQKAMAAIRALGGILGPRKPKTNELQSAEIMQLLGNLPQAGNVTPEVAAILGPKPGAGGPPPASPPMPPPGPGARPTPPPM